MRARWWVGCSSLLLVACGGSSPPSTGGGSEAAIPTGGIGTTGPRLGRIDLQPSTPVTTLASVDPALACSSYSVHLRDIPLGTHEPLGPLADGRVLLSRGIYDPWNGTVQEGAAHSIAVPAALLHDGTYLFVGNVDTGIVDRVGFMAADRYDPSSDSMIPTAALPKGRTPSSTIELLDGRVLLVGGEIGSWYKRNDGPVAPPQLYDPSRNEWRNTATLPPVSREPGAAARLGDGRVLVVGGVERPREELEGHPDLPPTDVAELYEPSTDSFRVTTPMLAARKLPIAVTASDGSVYVFGGTDERRAERFDPKTETWSWTAPSPRNMNFRRDRFREQALLPCGGVAFVFAEPDVAYGPSIDVLIYDPSSDRWTEVAYPGPAPKALVPSPVGALIFPRPSATGTYDSVRVLRP